MQFKGDGTTPYHGTSITFPSGFDFGSPSNGLTVEAWVQYTACPEGNAGWIYIYGGGGGNGSYVRLGCTTGPKIEWEVETKAASNGTTVQSPSSTASGGAWHHLVGVKPATSTCSDMTLYLDGAVMAGTSLVGNNCSTFTANISPTATMGFAFNPSFAGKDQAPVTLSQVAIYRSALDASTILTHYNLGVLGHP
jgi:hypothetical protein